MAGEEAGSKVVRLVAFLGAGVICTAAINMWRDLERKSLLKTTQASEKDSNVTPPLSSEWRGADKPAAVNHGLH